MDPLKAAGQIAGSGLQAQATRMRVVSENLANSRSTGTTPGADPYSRKTVQFEAELDRTIGSSSVKLKATGVDKSPFIQEYDPGNPAADSKGMVKLPNVNMMVELADMREASRTYEANLQMIKQTRSMGAMLLDLLRSQS
ncbi:flagellar basal body rod protein FlgC [Azorhizobium oxalatiphilum]|uniref:flagellar basal body rod protein FlgC n=1 Tax=Azorhizobium oxalatiphilum TaxID=980631 RepID=UPI00166AF3F2|nr:flagellar basal body rod protein FlgC [Azorhizobium oxalatiphilum]